MRTRIIAIFSLSALMFVLSWLSVYIVLGGYIWLLFFIAGALAAGFGVYFAAQRQ